MNGKSTKPYYSAKQETMIMLLPDADSFNKTCTLVITLTNQKLTQLLKVEMTAMVWYIMCSFVSQMVQYNGNVSVYEKREAR